VRPHAWLFCVGIGALIAGCSSGSSDVGASSGSPLPTASSPSAAVSLSPSPTPTHTRASVTASPSPTPTATVTVTLPTTAAPCSSSHLRLSLTSGQGTAGTTFQAVVLTNTGSRPCTLFGYPGVSFVNSGGSIIGKPSSRDGAVVRTVRLRVGGSASALSRQPDAGNFAPSACRPRTADRIQVFPPGQTVALFAPDAVQVCSTSTGRTGIGPMQPGTQG
jgi:Protein of unknown function (DUF4232)